MSKDITGFMYKIRFPVIIILLLWAIEAGEHLFGLHLQVLGIFPREWSGLPGIFTGPLVHGSWGHLASNTMPLLVLTSIVVLFYPKVAWQSFFTIFIGTGFMVWLFARPSFHIGASGVVYGLIAFVFWTGVFKKNVKSIVLALIVLTLYAGSVESMFPNTEKNISWESHLFGAIVGLVTAFIFKNVIEEDEKKYYESPWTKEDMPKQYFLSRDIFDKTKMQRYYEYIESQNQNQGDES
jgi:membrane associated rhomboid family serine protease